jgi:hypothetical protein
LAAKAQRTEGHLLRENKVQKVLKSFDFFDDDNNNKNRKNNKKLLLIDIQSI